MRFLPLSALLFLIACGPEGDPAFYHAQIPPVREAAPESLPGPALFDPTVSENLRRSRSLDDLMEVTRLIPLEVHDDGMIGDMTSMVHAHNRFYISDRLTRKLYCFDESGAFLFSFGSEGEGPGEHQHVREVRLTYDGNIGVADPFLGKVILFDRDGTFLKESNPNMDGKAIRARTNFVWETPDALVLVNFSSSNENAAKHLVLDMSEQQTIRFGFGQRTPEIYKAARSGMGHKAFTAFAAVDDTYWSGSPYHTVVNVYDRQGRLRGVLGKDTPRDPDLMWGQDDLDTLAKSREPNAIMGKIAYGKHANLLILPMGDLVMVQLGDFFDIYDRNGNMLAANRTSKTKRLLANYQGQLVMAHLPGMEANALGDEDLSKRLKDGYLDHDNPVLILYRFKPGLFPESGAGEG